MKIQLDANNRTGLLKHKEATESLLRLLHKHGSNDALIAELESNLVVIDNMIEVLE